MPGDRVYIVGPSDRGPMKIGSSAVGEIRHRINNLQPGYPGKLHCYGEHGGKIALLAEMKAHDLLKNRHIYGEWFDVTSEEANAAVGQALQMVLPDKPVLEQHRLGRREVAQRRRRKSK